jgi:EmrB/QacA subfamily drug resistance transporter
MKKYIPFVIAFALFMETLDATIISTAIPKIAINLHTNPISLKVALTSYLLSLAIFIPISGWFADQFGTNKVFITALMIFTMGSLLCGLAMNLQTLVLSRIIQGIGGALMMPVGRLIMLKSFPKSELIKVTNYVTIPSLIGPALGPVLGGVIVSYMSWRWIFMVNIPFGIAGVIFALKILDNHINTKSNSLDFIGFVLFGIGLAGFAFALESIGENTLSKEVIITIISSSLMILCIYFIRSNYITAPFLDLTVFKIRTFRITVLGSFLTRCGIGGMPFLLPLFFQLCLGKSPLYSGLLLLPYAIAMLMIKFFVKKGLKIFGFKNLLVANTFLLGLCILVFTFVNPQISFYLLLTILFILGLLTSVQFSCMNVLSYVDLNQSNVSKGTSIASAVQQLSMSFGIAISAITLNFLIGIHGNSFNIPTVIFQQVFLVLGLITIFTTFIFIFLKQEDGAEASHRKIYN